MLDRAVVGTHPNQQLRMNRKYKKNYKTICLKTSSDYRNLLLNAQSKTIPWDQTEIRKFLTGKLKD